MEYSIRNVVIRWQIKSTKVVRCIFILARTISEILMFQKFDLKKWGQDHGVQFSQ